MEGGKFPSFLIRCRGGEIGEEDGKEGRMSECINSLE